MFQNYMPSQCDSLNILNLILNSKSNFLIQIDLKFQDKIFVLLFSILLIVKIRLVKKNDGSQVTGSRKKRS